MVDVQLSNDTARKLLKTLIALGSKKTALSKDRKRVIRKLAGRFGVDFFEIATADGNPLKSRPTDPDERKAFYLAASVLLGIDAEDHDFKLLEKLAKIYKLGSSARKLDFIARDGEDALAGVTCETGEESEEQGTKEDSTDLEELKKYMKTEDSDEQSKGVFELIDEDALAEIGVVENPKKEPLKAKKVTTESKGKKAKNTTESTTKKKAKNATTESTTKKRKGTARTRSVTDSKKGDPKKTGTRRGKKLANRADSNTGSKDKKASRDKRPATKKPPLKPVHFLGIGAGILVLLIVIFVAWPKSKPSKFVAGTELANYNKLIERWNETQKKSAKLPELNALRDLKKNMKDLAQSCAGSDNPEVKNAGDELRKLLKSPSFHKTWDEVVETELTNLTLAVSEDRNKEAFNQALKKINSFPVEVLSSSQMKTQFDELKKNVQNWAGFSKKINDILKERPVTLSVLECAETFCIENKESRATTAYDRLIRWFTRQNGLAGAVYQEFLTAFYGKNKTRSATMIRILRKIKGNDFNK